MTDHQGFAQRLKQLRTQQNLSQVELGNLAELNELQVGRYERGQAFPKSDTLHKLAEALNTTTDFLLEGATDEMAIDRLSDRELLKQFQEVEKLPEDKKQTVKTMIGALLFEHRVMEQAAG